MIFPAPLQAFATAIDAHLEDLVKLIPADVAGSLRTAALGGPTSTDNGPQGFLLAQALVPQGVLTRVEQSLSGHVPRVTVLLPGLFTQDWGGMGSLRSDPRRDPLAYVSEVAPRRLQFLLETAPALMPRLARINRGAPEGVRVARLLAASMVLAAGAVVGIRARDLNVDRAVIRVGLALTVLLLRIEAGLAEDPFAGTGRAKPERRPVTPPVVSVVVVDGLLTAGGGDAGAHSCALTDADFHENGLVVSIPGGFVIRTGAEVSTTLVTVAEVDSEPSSVDDGWDDVVDVSFSASEDRVRLVGSPAVMWLDAAGDHRARVHARRRDVGVDEGHAGGETYKVLVWAAPLAPMQLLRATDRLGHRLRGAAEPAPVERPELAYRAISRRFGDATITVSVGSTMEEVLTAFRADPTSQPSEQLWDGLVRFLEISPGSEPGATAVLVVEPDGYRGTEKSVLVALSRHGRAASMYRNVNAVTRLSLAEGGTLLDAVEGLSEAENPIVRALFHGLDIHDYTDRVARGLVVIERFTGYAVTEEIAAQVQAMTVGYRLSS
jgi:hypothetical protein